MGSQVLQARPCDGETVLKSQQIPRVCLRGVLHLLSHQAWVTAGLGRLYALIPSHFLRGKQRAGNPCDSAVYRCISITIASLLSFATVRFGLKLSTFNLGRYSAAKLEGDERLTRKRVFAFAVLARLLSNKLRLNCTSSLFTLCFS